MLEIIVWVLKLIALALGAWKEKNAEPTVLVNSGPTGFAHISNAALELEWVQRSKPPSSSAGVGASDTTPAG